jgi:small-conductance mechanosensitive channel
MSMELRDLLEYEVWGNTVLTWGIALAVFFVVWTVLGIVNRVVRSRLGKLAERRHSIPLQIAAHVSTRTRAWFLFLIALLVGSRFVVWPAAVGTLLTRAVIIGGLVQIAIFATAALTKFMSARRERQLAEDPGAIAALDLLGFALQVFVWVVVLLVALDNLGVNVTALIAGLGIGGVAVALAAQNVLGDLFASLSIVLDKPFVVGDALAFGDMNGSVEKVGLKTTRLRSVTGEQLVVSNTDLLGSRIRNYGRMFERRVEFSIGVTYQTPAETLKRIPGMIQEAVESQQSVRFDRAHFSAYGDSALVFTVAYFVLSANYTLYMDIQQNINLLLYERFAQEGIEFAYPTRTVFLAGAASPAPDARA